MDDVQTRCVFLSSVWDVFAEDINYHANCLRNYVNKYDLKVNALFDSIETANDNFVLNDNCKNIFRSLDFGTT